MSVDKAVVQRDREVTREIHRLFWRANLQDKPRMWFVLITHLPAFFLQNVLVPVALAYAIQAVVQNHFDKVTWYTVLLVGCTAGYNLLLSLGTYAFNKQGVTGGEYVQRSIFSNYLNKDYEFYSDNHFGALGAQASRVRDAFLDYNHFTLFEIPKQTIIVGAGIVVIALKSLPLALLTLACMVLVLGFTIASSRMRLKYRREVGEASSNLAGVMGDALSHGATVKSFATEPYEAERLEAGLKDWRQAQLKSWNLFIPANAGRTMLGAFTTAALLLLTAHLYENHAISIAIVALIQLYTVKLIAATQDIAEMIKTYEFVMGASYQPVKIMMIEPIVTDKPQTRTVPDSKRLRLHFDDVSFRYSDASAGTEAVRSFTLNIAPGEKIGLVGYSGSGKTTLTKLLLRFMDVTGGKIMLNEVDIRDVKQSDLRKLIAYVPQEPLLFHRSIAENITYGKPGCGKRAMQAAAKLAYVDEFVDSLPKHYDTLVGERGVKLSGGQRQRVAIARALLKDAPLLVLDEATSALDSRSEKLIQRALWRLMKDRTALVIAHRLSTIQRMDRIVVMDKGRIVQAGTHEELLRDKKGVYARLWAHQSGGYVGVMPV